MLIKINVSGPPYDSNENEDYQVNQRNNERLRNNYNNNNYRDPIDTNRDNIRFPQSNDDFTSRNQFPPQYPPNNLGNNRFGDGVNNYNGVNGINNGVNNFNGVNGVNNFNGGNNGYNNYQNPYDAEYERKIRVETEKLRQLLIEIDEKNSAECSLNVAAQWNFETNVNEVSQIEAVSITSLSR